MEHTERTRRQALSTLSKTAVDASIVAKRRELFERHVMELEKLLRADVAKVLEEEAREVARTWTHDAQELLSWLMGDAQRVGESARANNIELVTEQLTHRIRSDTSVGAEEITDHSYELAQLLTANWLSILEAKLSDADGGFFALSDELLPRHAASNDFLEGVEEFAISEDIVAQALCEYQGSLIKGGDSVEITPTIFIRQVTPDSTFAFRPDAAAAIDAISSALRTKLAVQHSHLGRQRPAKALRENIVHIVKSLVNLSVEDAQQCAVVAASLVNSGKANKSMGGAPIVWEEIFKLMEQPTKHFRPDVKGQKVYGVSLMAARELLCNPEPVVVSGDSLYRIKGKKRGAARTLAGIAAYTQTMNETQRNILVRKLEQQSGLALLGH